MRAFALLLILVNICFFFWSQYIDVPEASLRTPTMQAGKPPPRLMLAKERQSDAEAKLTGELSCISIGPFGSATDLDQAQRRLNDAGFTSNARIEQGEIFVGYWVSLPGFATRADAQGALTRLQAAGITDAYILPDSESPGVSANVLSLGLFSEQARADARRNAISKLGFEPQMQQRTRHGEVHWLDVTLQEPGQLVDPALLQPASGGIVRLETHACPTSATEAMSGSSSSSVQNSASSESSSQPGR
jgi:SPOR domain